MGLDCMIRRESSVARAVRAGDVGFASDQASTRRGQFGGGRARSYSPSVRACAGQQEQGGRATRADPSHLALSDGEVWYHGARAAADGAGSARPGAWACVTGDRRGRLGMFCTDGTRRATNVLTSSNSFESQPVPPCGVRTALFCSSRIGHLADRPHAQYLVGFRCGKNATLRERSADRKGLPCATLLKSRI
jgi:hypothetical protein